MENQPEKPQKSSIKEQNRQLILQLMEQFNREIPDESAGLALIYRCAQESGLVKCPYCLDSEIEKLSDRRIKCKRCFKTIWITAGTLFHGVRRVRPYLAALYCHEHGAVFGSPWFARLLGIADSLAATIAKKIGLVIINKLPDTAPQVPSSAFIRLICRRSRETPRRAHPRAELDTIDALNRMPEFNNSESTEAPEQQLPELSESEQKVFDVLSEQPISFDQICEKTGLSAGELSAALTFLELKGLTKPKQSNKFIRIEPKTTTQFAQYQQQTHTQDFNTKTTEGNSELENLLAIIHETSRQIHGGFSRKCLQIYSALFWYHKDDSQWKNGKLLKACLRHPPIRYEDIVEYVSPALIKVWPKFAGAV